MPWVKKRVWIVTALLKDEDEEGNSLNWSSYIEEYTCETYDKALELKEKLLAGEDEYYGDLIESVEISDEPEEREFWQKEEEKATDERGEIFEKTQALGKAGSDLVSWFGDYAVYEKKFGVSDEQILEAYAELERSEIRENEREWRDNMADLKDDLIYGIEDKFTSQWSSVKI